MPLPAPFLRRPWLRIWLALGLATFSASAWGVVEETVVFRSGNEGYDTFRIPAVVRAPNGDLLAFAEGRKNSRSDTGDIDLVLKRSTDGGRTWGALQLLWNDGTNTCGNPCAVVDASTGVVWLLSTHNLGVDPEDAIARGTSRSGRSVWVLSSRDNGATWTAPKDITDAVKMPTWTWYATGPGIGVQVTHGPQAGRLLIPCDHNYQDQTTHKSVHAAHAIYSDDHGATWHLGGSIAPDMNECQMAELFDDRGGLLMDMRSYRGRGQRAESRSADGGISWTPAVDIPALVEPVCQASLLRWNRGAPGAGWLLFANPADPKRRRNLTVKASLDDGVSWSRSLVLRSGAAGYSSLVALDGTVAACLYEISDHRPYEQIVFDRFSAADLTASP